MSRTARRLLIVCIPLLACALYAAHFLLGRADRILEAKRRDRMSQVERELLRFEYEQSRAATSLADLVPSYLRRDEIENDHGPLYTYDVQNRTLAEAEGGVVHGLFAYRLPPAIINLPVTSHKSPTPVPVQTVADSSRPRNTVQTPSEPANSGDFTISERKTENIGPDSLPSDSSAPSEVQVSPAPNPTPQAAVRNEVPRAEFVKLRGVALAEPPQGTYVFEAEHFTEMNYAWEAHGDENSSGGTYFLCKEGIANNSAQTRYMVGNFYDVHASAEITYLKYHFNLPVSGNYYCYGRMWTTDTHCSNSLSVDFDQGGPGVGSMSNRTPFRWVWTEIVGNPRRLEKGDHYLHIFPWEDGIMIDQYILSPVPIDGAQPYKPNLVPGRGTAWERKEGPPAQLVFDVGSAVISPSLPPNIRIFVRKLRASTGTAKITARLKNAAADGGDIVVLDSSLDLDALPESGFLPLSFKALELEKIARREYVLEAALTKDGKTLAHTDVVLMKPWAWEVFGPGKYLENDALGPLDGEHPAPVGDKRAWAPFKDSNYDWFGVLDFGLQIGSNSKHAPTDCTIYARTRVSVPKAASYKFKVMADDQMVLWLDGEEIFRIDDRLPVTRSARSFNHALSAGEHHLRMRINQTDGPWQAFLRICSEDDDMSDIRGLEINGKP